MTSGGIVAHACRPSTWLVDACNVTRHTPYEIHSFRHKALERFYRHGSERGIPAHSVGKLRNQLAFLESMSDTRELLTPVLRWKAHELTGARAGSWALSVTANWRLTFTVDARGRLCDLNLEDYH